MRATTEDDEMLSGAMVLLIALGIFALIWVLILWGSRYFGPEHH